jgi:hypothetical protein
MKKKKAKQNKTKQKTFKVSRKMSKVSPKPGKQTKKVVSRMWLTTNRVVNRLAVSRGG